jgi:hypothetical protein
MSGVLPTLSGKRSGSASFTMASYDGEAGWRRRRVYAPDTFGHGSLWARLWRSSKYLLQHDGSKFDDDEVLMVALASGFAGWGCSSTSAGASSSPGATGCQALSACCASLPGTEEECNASASAAGVTDSECAQTWRAPSSATPERRASRSVTAPGLLPHPACRPAPPQGVTRT